MWEILETFRVRLAICIVVSSHNPAPEFMSFAVVAIGNGTRFKAGGNSSNAHNKSHERSDGVTSCRWIMQVVGRFRIYAGTAHAGAGQYGRGRAPAVWAHFR